MIFEGNTDVIKALKEKKRLMDGGAPHGHLKILLFVDGGLMKGAYGVGVLLALEESGFQNVFSDVVGVSSGAPSAVYFLAGGVQKGAGVLYDECCGRRFMNIWRFWNQVDTRYFMSILKGQTGKGISAEKLFESKSRLHIGVANFDTGEPELLRPTNSEELFQAIHASILMPNVSTDKVIFNAVRYADGGFTKPHILQKTLESIEATHILILTNQDKTITTIPRLERFLNHTLFRLRMSKALRFAAHERRRERLKVLHNMEERAGVPYALVWGDHSIRGMERDSEKVRKVVEETRQWWLELLKST